MTDEQEIKRDIEKAQNLIDQTKTELNKAEGSIETNMKHLETEFEITTTKDAASLIKNLSSQEESLLKNINKEYEALMGEVDLEL